VCDDQIRNPITACQNYRRGRAEVIDSLEICYKDWLSGRWVDTDFERDVIPMLIKAWREGKDPAFDKPGPEGFPVEEGA
jgi:hypothetical protein